MTIDHKAIIARWNGDPTATTTSLAREFNISVSAVSGVIGRARERDEITRDLGPAFRIKKPLKPQSAKAVKAMTEAVANLRAGQCRWPVASGEAFAFCCNDALPNKPYCAEHRARSRGHE